LTNASGRGRNALSVPLPLERRGRRPIGHDPRPGQGNLFASNRQQAYCC